MEKKRTLIYYKNYFKGFYSRQTEQIKSKTDWTVDLIETLAIVPKRYFKHLSGTDGLYEIRVQTGGNIFRIFSFFDENRVVICHGFQKKTDKTPQNEIARAIKIKRDYENEKYNYTRRTP